MTPEHTALVARLVAHRVYDPKYGRNVECQLSLQAAAAIRALAGRSDAATTRSKEWAVEFGRASGERDTLRAEVAALRKDAERYRWLRDTPPWRSPVAVTHAPLPDDTVYLFQEHLDAAVDAALDKPLSGPTP